MRSDLLIASQFAVAEPPVPSRVMGWRLKYPAEGGNYNPPNEPAVAPSANARPVRFTSDLQWLSWMVMSYNNAFMTTTNWANVFKGDKAFTNHNGWDNQNEPDDQRHDYVNDRYTTYEDPLLMKAIICAGNFFRGEVEGDELVMYPNTHGIDVNRPLPDVLTIMNKGWYFYATNNTPNPSHFDQGQGGPVVIPYFLRERTPYPLKWFERWDSQYLPRVLKYGG